MKKEREFYIVLDIIIAAIIIACIIGIWIINGIVGAALWTVAMIILPIAGIVLSIFAVISLIVGKTKNRPLKYRFLTLVLALVMIAPILNMLSIVEIAYPSCIDDNTITLTIESPFKETTIIGWGGESVADNKPHAVWASERWAYDIVAEPYDVGSSELDDYGIYDMEVYSPVGGTVVAVENDDIDIEPNSEDTVSMAGNHVYIHVEETDTYLLMNHFKQGSIVVNVGDAVEAGTYLGNIGNSGMTSEPHLHIHHQKQNPNDTLYYTIAEGLPLYFKTNSDSTEILTKGEELTGTEA